MEQVVRAEMVASVHSLVAQVGDELVPGDVIVILESMKMEIALGQAAVSESLVEPVSDCIDVDHTDGHRWDAGGTCVFLARQHKTFANALAPSLRVDSEESKLHFVVSTDLRVLRVGRTQHDRTDNDAVFLGNQKLPVASSTSYVTHAGGIGVIGIEVPGGGVRRKTERGHCRHILVPERSDHDHAGEPKEHARPGRCG